MNARVSAPPISTPMFSAVIDHVTLQCERGTERFRGTVLERNTRTVPSVNTVLSSTKYCAVRRFKTSAFAGV